MKPLRKLVRVPNVKCSKLFGSVQTLNNLNKVGLIICAKHMYNWSITVSVVHRVHPCCTHTHTSLCLIKPGTNTQKKRRVIACLPFGQLSDALTLICPSISPSAAFNYASEKKHTATYNKHLHWVQTKSCTNKQKKKKKIISKSYSDFTNQNLV